MLYFFKKLKPFWYLIVIVFICDGFITLASMIPPLFSVAIFDYAYPKRSLELFTFVTLISFAIYILDFIFSALIDYMNIYLHQELQLELTVRVFSKLTSLPLRFFHSMNRGELTVRLTDDVSAVVYFIVNVCGTIATNGIKLAIFIVVAYMFDYTLIILLLIAVPFYIIEMRFFSAHLGHVREELKRAESDFMERIQSNLINMRMIKAFQKETYEGRHLAIRLRKSFIVTLKESLLSIMQVFSNSLTIQVMSLGIAWYLGYEVIANKITVGELIALTMYIPLLEGPIKELSHVYTSYTQTLVSSRRIREILDGEEEAVENKQQIIISDGSIIFDSVNFAYDRDVPALHNFNLQIRGKSSVAIVGDSGSGKSTLVNLLIRFYSLDKGKIIIDGQDINSIDLHSLRKNCGIVFQETTIIPGTIRENLLYGVDGAKSDEELRQAVIDASLEDTIKKFPRGLDTPIDSYGRCLSHGEAQRVAIARVLLKNPKIFVLDEPTSALDAISEFHIQESLNRIMGSRTLIVIAHRLSTIKKVDRIVVLSAGSIVEEGTFNELLDKKGAFFRLYHIQFGGFGQFLQNLQIELQRVERYGQDLSLLLLRVLSYESIVREYSQTTASTYMEELNLSLKYLLRIMDFSSVYRDDTIAIALPETNREGAAKLEERIHKKLSELKITVGTDIISPQECVISIVSCKEEQLKFGEDIFERGERNLLARIS